MKKLREAVAGAGADWLDIDNFVALEQDALLAAAKRFEEVVADALTLLDEEAPE